MVLVQFHVISVRDPTGIMPVLICIPCIPVLEQRWLRRRQTRRHKRRHLRLTVVSCDRRSYCIFATDSANFWFTQKNFDYRVYVCLGLNKNSTLFWLCQHSIGCSHWFSPRLYNRFTLTKCIILDISLSNITFSLPSGVDFWKSWL